MKLVESRTLLNFEKTLSKSLREFFFGNSQIGFASQGLQISYMELGTPHETRFYLSYQTKFSFEKKRKRFRERDD